MKRTARRVRVTTTALTQPKPNFVSAVWAGANQLPWTALKGEGAVLTLKAEDLSMTLKSLKEAGVEIAAIAFDAAKFADETSVRKWLDDGGYEGFTVEKSDSGSYVVKSAEEFVGDMRVIEADGVKLTVGALKSSVEAAEKAAADAAPAPEPDVKVIAPVEEAEQPSATEKSVEIAPIPEDRAKSMYTVSELNSLVCGLKYVIHEMKYEIIYGGDAAEYEASMSALKAAAATVVDVMVKMFNMEAAELMAQFTSSVQASADEAPASTETVVEPAPDADGGGAVEKADEAPAPAADAAPVDEAINSSDPMMKSIADMLANITKSVEGLAGQVTEVASKQDALGARVETLETGKPVAAPQTRKSADVDDVAQGSADDKADKKSAKGLGDIALRGGLGITVQRFHGEKGSRHR